MVKFSHIYKKQSDRLYTTVRRWTKKKEDYYKSMIAKEGFGTQGLIQVLKCKFGELTPEFILYDGEDTYTFNFKPEDDVLILFLLEGARTKAKILGGVKR